MATVSASTDGGLPPAVPTIVNLQQDGSTPGFPAWSLDYMVRAKCDGAPGPAVTAIIKWCCQRLPTPLVEFWCDTTAPSTLDHIQFLRTAIGVEEYGLVLFYKEAHLEHGDLKELEIIKQFNEGFDAFVKAADEIKAKGNAATAQERAEAETLRVATNALVPKMSQRYQHQLRQMMDVRRRMREAREEAQSKRESDGTTTTDGPFPVGPELLEFYRKLRHSVHCPRDMRGRCALKDECVKTVAFIEHARTCAGGCENGEKCANARKFLGHYTKCLRNTETHRQCQSCQAVLKSKSGRPPVARAGAAGAAATAAAAPPQTPVPAPSGLQRSASSGPVDIQSFGWNDCSGEVKMLVQAVLPRVQALARKRTTDGLRDFLVRTFEQARAQKRRLDNSSDAPSSSADGASTSAAAAPAPLSTGAGSAAAPPAATAGNYTEMVADTDCVRFSVCPVTKSLIAYPPKDNVGVITGISVFEDMPEWTATTGILARDALQFKEEWKKLSADAAQQLLGRILSAADISAAQSSSPVDDSVDE